MSLRKRFHAYRALMRARGARPPPSSSYVLDFTQRRSSLNLPPSSLVFPAHQSDEQGRAILANLKGHGMHAHPLSRSRWGCNGCCVFLVNVFSVVSTSPLTAVQPFAQQPIIKDDPLHTYRTMFKTTHIQFDRLTVQFSA